MATSNPMMRSASQTRTSSATAAMAACTGPNVTSQPCTAIRMSPPDCIR